MHRVHSVVHSLRVLPATTRTRFPPRAFPRRLHTQHEDKYFEKLRKVAAERGLSISELREKIKQEEQKRQQRLTLISAPERLPEPAPFESVRKDSSPVKPLSSILNIPRILASPHTVEQISALWTVYHASRSNGTGRGYLCAAVPLDLYTQMASTAAKYPIFVAPLRRNKDPAAPAVEGETDAAHEFYFLQWAFHDAPPIPSPSDDLFSPPPAENATPSPPNPQTSTVMFTPLQEYKMRGSFATPYLVLTFYTDLARSHGVVLLRGEITPSAAAGSAGVDGRYLLQQDDAHRLSLSIEKFFLWNGDDREKLVQAFHETPDKFEWEELLKHAI
ncbi:ATP11 protein-domain-containing protein [Mycena maculata]|uniref:ATP11 protein-domain-containing protein n=1 Tax=Mycena maculata TaxID=230809 RepID=A0AAD7JV09_9AGAR|nr:ATP11 protein-domain-containing protein [Mycena maculata]